MIQNSYSIVGYGVMGVKSFGHLFTTPIPLFTKDDYHVHNLEKMPFLTGPKDMADPVDQWK